MINEGTGRCACACKEKVYNKQNMVTGLSTFIFKNTKKSGRNVMKWHASLAAIYSLADN